MILVTPPSRTLNRIEAAIQYPTIVGSIANAWLTDWISSHARNIITTIPTTSTANPNKIDCKMTRQMLGGAAWRGSVINVLHNNRTRPALRFR